MYYPVPDRSSLDRSERIQLADLRVRPRGPLSQPGNEARVDEYILAVNGRELTSDDNLFATLHGTAGDAAPP